jgi:hypothetical protein
MATTTKANTNTTPSLAQRAAFGILSSLPATTPALKVIQKALPHFPNLQTLGNGISSAMTVTQPAGTGTQNTITNTSQNNMCDVGSQQRFSALLAYPLSLSFTELPHTSQVARSCLRSVARVLFKDLREG